MRAGAARLRGYVYVLTHPREPGHVKIGTASKLKDRLRCANAHCPTRSYTLYANVLVDDRRALERAVHRALAHLREGTTEWFRIAPSEALEVLTNLSSHAIISTEQQ